MRIKRPLTIPVTLFFAAFAAPPLQHGSPHGVEAPADPGWSALIVSMEKMHHAMGSVAPSGDSDEDFVRLMLPHHQAALDMAKAELLFGRSPEMRRLAQEIIADQQSEIDLMELWLKKHAPERPKGAPSPAPNVQGAPQ
jgi:uncharacterized protein (DUF305 family)